MLKSTSRERMKKIIFVLLLTVVGVPRGVLPQVWLPHFSLMIIVRTFLFLLACASAPVAFAHGGGLNADGCHNNRKTGDYHCHKPPPLPPSQQQQIDQSSTSNKPTCYTGPKGGTYTITPSGRKNYQGC